MRVIVGVVVLAFVFVCLLGLGVLVNAVQTRAELTESLGESLSPHAVLSYARSTLLVVVIKGLAFSVLSVGILLVGLALLCLGAYPAGAVVQIAAAHLRWQIYRHHVDRGGDPITLKEPQPLPSEAARAPFMSGSFGGF